MLKDNSFTKYYDDINNPTLLILWIIMFIIRLKIKFF